MPNVTVPQAMAVLLAAAPASVAAIGQQLAHRVLGRCGGECTAELKGRDWSSRAGRTRGELQSLLATFFKGCPAGAVVVTEVEKMHPGLLPVVNNVLSEQVRLVVQSCLASVLLVLCAHNALQRVSWRACTGQPAVGWGAGPHRQGLVLVCGHCARCHVQQGAL